MFRIAKQVATFSARSNVISLRTLSSVKYQHGKHRSNAESLIDRVPVIEVEGTTAICDGGSGALGHPIEYIQLNTVSDKPQVCKYCGLRFVGKKGHGH